MTVEPGRRLGPYEIVASIGAGGMGEVWRARDTRLDRDVAIKVLPPGLAQDAQFLERFAREGRAISQLSHPHVCTLYDVGTEGDLHYLVMELLEGESLADRLKKGALPLPEVFKLGAQIASALDAAHQRGIVHRDLKPGNVVLTRSGAKLLDFGLAKAGTGKSAPITGLAGLPTEEKPLTAEGTILGTFQYMAPEQLEGIEADARTDIFALGAVLYEMATGRRAFQGGSRTSLIAAIVASQPEPISSVVAMSPPALDHVVRKCLEKDPDDRWQSARDVAAQLAWISEAGSRAGLAPAVSLRRRTRERLGWIAAVVLIGVGAVVAATQLRSAAAPPPPPMMFTIPAPEGTWLNRVLVSRDGRRLLMRVIDERGEPSLWVRSVATGRLAKLVGTAEARNPFLSPDGEWVGFFIRSRLFKVPVDGPSGPQELTDRGSWFAGIDWGANGTIVFTPSWDAPLYAVSDRGGKASPVTTLEPGEQAHANPTSLPDGRLLFDVLMKPGGGRQDDAGIYVQKPGEPGKRLLLRARPGYWDVSDGRLAVYAEDPPRVALRSLEARTLALGPPEEHALPIEFQWGWTSVDRRILAGIERGPQRQHTATWYDRSGKVLGTVGEPGFLESPAISPDGSHVALEYAGGGTQEIRNYELRRGIAISVHKSETTWRQIWSGDGRSILFGLQTEPGRSDIAQVSADGTGAATLLVKGGDHYCMPYGLSRDGRWLLYGANSSDDPTYDLWLEDLESPGHPRRLVESPPGVDEANGRFSPDGSWVSYTSDESGRNEIYLVQLASGRRIRVSPDGGFQPRWRGDGRELFYLTRADEMMAVSVERAGDDLTTGVPKVLFRPPTLGMNDRYDVTGDGQRFLVLTGEQYRPTSLTILLNWFEGPPKS